MVLRMKRLIPPLFLGSLEEFVANTGSQSTQGWALYQLPRDPRKNLANFRAGWLPVLDTVTPI